MAKEAIQGLLFRMKKKPYNGESNTHTSEGQTHTQKNTTEGQTHIPEDDTLPSPSTY